MAKPTRDRLKQFHGQGMNDLDRFLSNIQKMVDIYGERYPNQTTTLEQIAGFAINLQTLFQRFRDEML